MIVSVDVEVKERLENWRRWVRNDESARDLSSKSTVYDVLYNTAQAANYSPRPLPVDAECEETDSWLQTLLEDPDTYFGALAVKMVYENHRDFPTSKHAIIFPKAYEWMNWKKNGGSFDDFRMAVTRAQNLKRTDEQIYDVRKNRGEVVEVGVSIGSFAGTELEGRNMLIGMIKHARMPIKRAHIANVYHLQEAHQIQC